jgi:hypothetical protein
MSLALSRSLPLSLSLSFPLSLCLFLYTLFLSITTYIAHILFIVFVCVDRRKLSFPTNTNGMLKYKLPILMPVLLHFRVTMY